MQAFIQAHTSHQIPPNLCTDREGVSLASLRDHLPLRFTLASPLCYSQSPLRGATMKRRNFLSGLLAGPLALKARLARFFGRKPVELCNAPIGNRVMWNRADPESPEGQHSLYMSEALEALPDAFRSQGINLDGYSAPCCLRRGHKGPHVLLNPR